MWTIIAFGLLTLTNPTVNFSILANSSYGANQIKVCFFKKWAEAIDCKYIEKVSNVKDWLSLTPRKIEIRGQNLKRLQPNDFSRILFVKELVIRDSKLTDIEPGTFSQSLSFLKLDFQFNELEDIKTGVFNDLFVTFLNFNNNKVKVIERDALSFMQNLEEIYLESNKLTNYDSHWFYKTPLLKDLHFENNSIVNITEQAFRNLGTKAVLPNIYMSLNRISYVDQQAFEGMGNTTIGKLHLDHNFISQLNERSLININELKISFNKIQCITSNLHKLIKNNDVKNFEHNPYNCTCLKEIKILFDERHDESVWFKNEYLKCRSLAHEEHRYTDGIKFKIFSSP